MELTRRRLLQSTALATVTLPFVRAARGAATIVPSGKMVLAWHTNIAARWLDPQQHDGTATPDNFINALHDALIKNSGTQKFDHLGLAEKYEFAEDAKSCTFRLRAGAKFHDGSPVTPADVKWSYEHYHGAWADVLRKKTQDIETVDDRTVRFHFNNPFLDFPNPDGHEQRVRRWLGPPGELLREGRAGRLHAEADRRRAVQAGVAAAGDPARFRGLRRLLPPGARQGVHDEGRPRGGNARRDAGARRSGHHVFRSGRTDRPG